MGEVGTVLCLSVTPLSSHIQEATAVTILEDRQSPARRLAEKGLWQREEKGHSEQKKASLYLIHSSQVVSPGLLPTLPRP